MPNWDEELPGCFGGLFFSKNLQEEDRAFNWLIDLRKRAVGWKEVRAQLEAFLESHHVESTHIRQQIERAQVMLKPWLDD
jgi:hypothetical protein